MWIKCTNKATRAFFDAECCEEKIYLSENGTVNVPREVGEALVAKYDAFVAVAEEDDEEEEEEE